MNLLVLSTLTLWFQLTPPYGTYYSGSSVKDSPVKTITFNQKSLDAIVYHYRCSKESDLFPGIPVDHEHSLVNRGYDYDDVVAWIKDIKVDKDGSIWGKLIFSEGWEKAYRLKDFPRYISPVLDTNVEVVGGKPTHVPCRLISVAFTRKPRLPLNPNPTTNTSRS